jgi:hypothetical protein
MQENQRMVYIAHGVILRLKPKRGQRLAVNLA